MARTNPALHAFNAGEVSKIALARVDVAKMRLAAQCQLNWMPFVMGAMMQRPGLIYTGETKGDQASWLIDFVFGKTDTALLELTPDTMRVWINDVVVTRPSVSTAVSDPSFNGGGNWVTTDTTSGAGATLSSGLTLACEPRGGLAKCRQEIVVSSGDYNKEHGVRITVNNGPVTTRAGSSNGASDYIAQTVLDTGTHCLAFTPTSNIFLQFESTVERAVTVASVTIDSAGTLEVPTPWGASDLPNLRWTQSGDIIYVARNGGQQYKIERRSTHGWSVVKYQSDTGPFASSASAAVKFTPSVYHGNGTLTANLPYFKPEHVGTLFRLFSNGQIYETLLGGNAAFTPAWRVSGVGPTRNFTWTVSGVWAGTVTLQRSFDGPDRGFVDVTNTTSNGSHIEQTDGLAGSLDLNNVIAWYRLGFKDGDYTSGSADVNSGYTGGGGFGIVRVTGYTSPTSVIIEIIDALSSVQATADWQESDWSDVLGWPSSVAFQEGRLGWSGRDMLWLSESDNYVGYAQEATDGTSIGDAGAIVIRFGQGPVDRVNWLLGLTRLLAGREGSVASIRSSSFDEPLTPTNISVKDCSTQGAARLAALKVDKHGIYVQQAGRRVYAVLFNPQEMDYQARDLTRLNIDIGKPGFVDTAIAMQSDRMAYFVRTEGQLAALLYEPDDEIEAWWRAQTLGVIENVRVLPSSSNEDTVYVVVKRTVNGSTKRFIERFAARDNCVGGTSNQMLDSCVVYSGVSTNTVTLAHLPSTTVKVWADGAYIGEGTTDGSGVLTPLPDNASHSVIVAGLGGSVQTKTNTTAFSTFTGLSAFEGYPAEVFADQQPSGRMAHVGTLTVSSGVLTLPNGWTACNMVAFFGYVSPFMSAKLAYAGQMGSPLNQKKKIDHVGLCLFDASSAGIQFGQRFDQLDSLPAYEDEGAVGTVVWNEFDEPTIALPGEWDSDARLCLLAQAPYPVKVGAAVISLAVNEK